MGKFERKRKRKFCKWIWVICLPLLVGFLTLFVMPRVLYQMNEGSAQDDITHSTTQNQNEETQITAEDSNTEYGPDTVVEFPAVLDGGNIEIESLFQFSGVNPDSDKQDATDVASIVLRNTSGTFLKEATVNAVLDSGTELKFTVTELPAGASAMAFSVDNENLLATNICTEITVKTAFEEIANDDHVDVAVTGMTVTITNVSSEDLNNIYVYYRDVFNDKYFGGMAYCFKIEKLPAGEKTTFTAEESLLGAIEVVSVAVNEKN